ncbi:polysaccharide pyruvyl transferase family protein [Ketobacter sp.]
MKFFIINAYGRSNRGDSVLLDECIFEIHKYDHSAVISGAVFHGVEDISSIHKDVSWGERIGNRVTRSLIGKVFAVYCLVASIFVFKLKFRFLLKTLPDLQAKTAKGMIESDVIVSAPGGYIHDTNNAYFIALYHIFAGLILKKKVILAPQSFGPVNSRIGRFLTRWVLSKVDVICTREAYSYDFIVNTLHLNPLKVFKCGDSAFWSESSDGVLPDDLNGELREALNNKKVLGVTFVGWNFPHNPKADELLQSYIKKMANIIDVLVEEYGLFPVAFNQVDNDIKTANLVKKCCKSSMLVDEVCREPEYLRAMISRSTIFLGTRFHSCIFAMMENVPTFAIAYLPKTKFILADLGLKKFAMDIEKMDEIYIVEQLRLLLKDLSYSKLKLSEAINKYKHNYMRFSDVLIDSGIDDAN